MTYTCKYGHTHRTESGMQYCHVNIPWTEKSDLITKTPWKKEGTTNVWSDLGDYRALFWISMRDKIIIRDKVCQYENCDKTTSLEVHHIVPRRLGGTDHPANLITLCHDHHRIQAAHHYDTGIILCDADIQTSHHKRIRQARPQSEKTLSDFTQSF